MRVASVAWKLRLAHSDGEFFGHFYDLINEAHRREADVVVLPELMCLELLSLAPDLEEKDVPAFLVQFASGIEDWIMRIATSSEMTLVGGSHFRMDGERIVNACATGTPDGRLAVTTKASLSDYERIFWRMKPGQEHSLLPDRQLGVMIGYDCEQEEAVRPLKESGAAALLVPAFTQNLQAFERVRYACRLRAEENDFFVVHSSLVGSLGYPPAPGSYGTSAILAPSGAVLAETLPNEEGIAVAEVELGEAPGDAASWKFG